MLGLHEVRWVLVLWLWDPSKDPEGDNMKMMNKKRFSRSGNNTFTNWACLQFVPSLQYAKLLVQLVKTSSVGEVLFCYSGKVQMYTVQHLNAVTSERLKGQQEEECHVQAPCHQLCESAGSLVLTKYVCPGAASTRQGLQVSAST